MTVKDGGEIVFQICPDTDLAHGPATADRQSLSGPCLIAGGVTYLEAGDLAYLLGMTDVEIAKRLGLNRSTVQYRRTSTLEQLRKIMEENGYEYHKQ